MFNKKIRIRQEKDKSTEKKIFSIDYYKAENKKCRRFDLFNHFMKDRNTVIHINTNFTASVPPSEDRENLINFRNMCEKDNLDFYMSPAARENRGGVLGKIIKKEESKFPAYNILMFIPSGSFTKEIFDSYMCTYFFRAGTGFEAENYEKIKSDFKTGLLTSDEFYKMFDYDIFDAFEFNHMKIISDKITETDLKSIFS